MPADPFAVTATPDLDAVVATLVEAFRDDPVLRWTMPPEVAERDRWLDGFFRETTSLLLAHDGLVGHTPDHEAVAVWSPPGEPDLDETADAAWQERLATATGPCAARATALMAALDDHHPADLPPHVHVMFAAARPEAWGSGVVLVRALSRRLGRDDTGLYAEASSQASLGLWQEMGMRRVGNENPAPRGPVAFPDMAGRERAYRVRTRIGSIPERALRGPRSHDQSPRLAPTLAPGCPGVAPVTDAAPARSCAASVRCRPQRLREPGKTPPDQARVVRGPW